MALYVVVHHRRDKNQTSVNAWLDDELIEAIQTTTELEHLCWLAKERMERANVHRCGRAESPPVACYSTEVVEVGPIDKATALVRFASPVRLELAPPRVPVKG